MMPRTGSITMQALKKMQIELICLVTCACVAESERHGWAACARLPRLNWCCYETKCECKPHQTSPQQQISVNVSLCCVSVLTDCFLHFIMLNANFHTRGETCFTVGWGGGGKQRRVPGALERASREKGMSPAGSLLPAHSLKACDGGKLPSSCILPLQLHHRFNTAEDKASEIWSWTPCRPQCVCILKPAVGQSTPSHTPHPPTKLWYKTLRKGQALNEFQPWHRLVLKFKPRMNSGSVHVRR